MPYCGQNGLPPRPSIWLHFPPRTCREAFAEEARGCLDHIEIAFLRLYLQYYLDLYRYAP